MGGGAVRGFDEVRAMLRRLRGAVDLRGIRVDLPAVAAERIGHLAAGGRDVTETSPVLEAEVARAFEDGLARVRDGAPAGTPAALAGEAVLRRLRLRVAQGGADLTFPPLSPETVRRKGSGRLFVDSGELLRALSAAKVRAVRR